MFNCRMQTASQFSFTCVPGVCDTFNHALLLHTALGLSPPLTSCAALSTTSLYWAHLRARVRIHEDDGSSLNGCHGQMWRLPVNRPLWWACTVSIIFLLCRLLLAHIIWLFYLCSLIFIFPKVIVLYLFTSHFSFMTDKLLCQVLNVLSSFMSNLRHLHLFCHMSSEQSNTSIQ